MTTLLVATAFIAGVLLGGWAVARYIGKNFDAISGSVKDRIKR